MEDRLTRSRTRQSFAQVESTREVSTRYDYMDGYGWREWTPSTQWSHATTDLYNPRSSGCTDVNPGYGRDNPLTIIHENVRLGRITASMTDEIESSEPYPYKLQIQGVCDTPIVSYPNWDEDRAYTDRVVFATKAAADVNPSKAKVDVAVFIGELRDLPSLFKNVGDDIFKYGANEYLKAQYGWRPLIKDLRNFFKVVNLVDKRMRNLERLNKDKMLRLPYRNKNPEVTLGAASYTEMRDMFPGWQVELDTQVSWRTSRWATVAFATEVPENLVTLPSKDTLARVNQALYGGVVDGATLWQLMPWSWLFDWSSNVGDFLAANRNVVGAKVTDITVMESSDVASTTNLVDWHSVGGIHRPSSSQSAGVTLQVRKTRFPEMSPSVITRGDVDIMFDTFKLPILTALAIQRFKK